MGFWDLFNGGKPREAKSAPKVTSAAELITVYDERGRELKITKADWLRSVLYPAIRKDWSDADKLYGHIINGLRDDLAAHLLSAAERLVELDDESERALIVRAIVLLQADDLDGAEEALNDSIKQHGKSAASLTNLAKVLDKREETEGTENTLREALTLDPNFENALGWWSALARERGGDEGYRAALEELARAPKAYLARIWLAREALKAGEVGTARKRYEQALDVAADEPNVLMTVSGDLGNAGKLDLLVELVAPRYDIAKHGPFAGMNLAEALKELGRVDEASKLVRELSALNVAPLAARLGELGTEIARRTPNKAMTEQPQIGVMSVDGPLWLRGLFDASWVLPPLSDDAPELIFPALTSEISSSAQIAEVQKSNDIGRLTRALPLYWNARFRMSFEVTAKSLMFVMNPGGPAVIGGRQAPEDVARFVGEAKRRQIIVAGSVTDSGVRIEAWDRTTGKAISLHEAKGAHSELGTIALELAHQLERSLLDRGLVKRRGQPFAEPPPQLVNPHLLSYEQLFYQALTANEISKLSDLFNERSFFELCFGVLEDWPNPPDHAQMVAVSSAVMGSLYKSTLVAPYRKLVLGWLDGPKAGSVLDAVGPAVLRRLGDDAKLEQSLARAEKCASPGSEQAAWLARVRKGD